MTHNGYKKVLLQITFSNIKSVLAFTLLKVKSSIRCLTQSFILKSLFPLLFCLISFRPHLTVTPDQKKMILVGRYLDVIEIYNTDGQLIKLLKGPKENLDFKFDEEKSMQNSVLIKITRK